MKTTNWQTKALTLFIALTALCLTATCAGSEYGKRYTPSAPCGPAVPLTESVEFAQLKDTSDLKKDRESTVREERLRLETERIEAILDKYEDRILAQSPARGGFVHGWGVSSIRNENDELTEKLIIQIMVTEYVDQSTLPPEVRIPECLEGVEVHFWIAPMGELLTDRKENLE